MKIGAIGPPGRGGAELLAGYKDVGVDRVQGLDLATAISDEALEVVAEDARAADVDMEAELAPAR